MFLCTPVNPSSRSTSAPCVPCHVTLIFRWRTCGKSAHVRPQGFERPCRKAIFTRPIFCMSLSGTAGPLRHRKDLLAPTWKSSTTLPSPRSHSCASSHVLPFSKKSCSLFVLLKRCRLVTGLFWGAMDRFAGLFDVFYYIFLVKAPVKLTNSTFCAQCVVKCPNPKISN